MRTSEYPDRPYEVWRPNYGRRKRRPAVAHRFKLTRTFYDWWIRHYIRMVQVRGVWKEWDGTGPLRSLYR